MPIMADFVGAEEIAEVLDRLDAEIESGLSSGSRHIFFTCLYRRVTKQVMDDIERGRFEDGPRLAKLDVVFANRYLAALHAYQARERASRSWEAAFEAAERGRLTVLQHLLLGINAHINLDLGIAAAEIAPGASLPALRRDFDEISDLLGEMLDDVQDRLAMVSPWLGLLDMIGGRTDEEICTFCIGGARDLAWRWAEKFARLDPPELSPEIESLDRKVAFLSLPIRKPTPLLATSLALVRMRESGDVPKIVDALLR
jgi:Family of unknown function (DUF5995)